LNKKLPLFIYFLERTTKGSKTKNSFEQNVDWPRSRKKKSRIWYSKS